MSKTDQMSFFGFEAEPAPAPAKSVKAKTGRTAVPTVKLPDLTLSELTQPAPAVVSLSPAAHALPEALTAHAPPVLPAHGAPEQASDVEAMAQTLSQHPDFRVLRRLQPRTDYGPLNGQTTRRVIVLDTETTGLDARNEKVIELAMLSVLVDSATGQPVGPVTLYESFEDPGKPIPPQITEITGIDDSMVQGQRIDDAAVTALVDQADLIVAHNAGFDRPFVEVRWPVFARKAWNCSFAGIDWKKEGSGSAKLEFLASERGWFYDAHRAQVDCHALLQVLSSPLADGQTGLSRLLNGAGQTRYKLRATGAPFEAKDKLKSRGYRWDGEGRVWWCSLASDDLLAFECTWLRAEVYGQRSARVQLEAMDSLVQFSSRAGLVTERAV
ncbi:DNA polymerase III subunit epsilon [Limnohabitans sp. MMS-10A-160]|uniref:3'-5' exonuclease n=1 Tax=unclassified Limnohabitans TaxID=2626134 RepID=UPI000D376463|nr:MULTISPECIES: 3'-5' exonuclease [unclassified Limnohabitans]PUE18963.1 DNA polymerase III subunit epsilon [Limnohabitans sp. MMS-10A-192]PUE24431.1 DNA polymerase III subunit epsilon [Limnohabitans sp. MMS-10A-160]